jgi:hypothetical protein
LNAQQALTHNGKRQESGRHNQIQDQVRDNDRPEGRVALEGTEHDGDRALLLLLRRRPSHDTSGNHQNKYERDAGEHRTEDHPINNENDAPCQQGAQQTSHAAPNGAD